MTQLDLFAPKKKTVLSVSRAAALMIAVLAMRRTWTTRAQFAIYGLTDRECRMGRKASHGRIIYGQRGYILMRDATPDEIRACLCTTASMIGEMQDDYRLTARRAHGVLSGRMESK